MPRKFIGCFLIASLWLASLASASALCIPASSPKSSSNINQNVFEKDTTIAAYGDACHQDASSDSGHNDCICVCHGLNCVVGQRANVVISMLEIFSLTAITSYKSVILGLDGPPPRTRFSIT